MALDSLAQQEDVETALLRALTPAEAGFIDDLIAQASALLRNAAPSVDERMAAYAADPTDRRGVSPEVVTAVLAGIVKRYITNPRGIASTTDTIGPIAHGETYALRSEKDARGLLQVTAEDLSILFPSRKRLRAGSIRLRPGLAPRPVGHYGGFPTAGDAIAASIMFTPNLRDGEFPVDPLAFTEGG